MCVRAWLIVAAALPACGRFDFDETGGDAPGSAVDYPAAVLADGPRAYYRLGDAAGAPILRDVAGNNQHADVIVNGDGRVTPVAGALPGDPDTATQFFGSGNFAPGGVAYGEFPAVWPTWASDFTIEAFVNAVTPAGPAVNHALLFCESYLADGFRIGWNELRQIDLWASESGGADSVESVGSLRVTWTHLAIVRRGTMIEIYFDAVSDVVGSFTYVTPTATAVCGFGSLLGTPSDLILDELAIYDTALSSAQIAVHFAASGR